MPQILIFLNSDNINEYLPIIYEWSQWNHMRSASLFVVEEGVVERIISTS